MTFPHLSYKDLLKCRLVSKVWCKLLLQSSVWRNFLQVDLEVLLTWFNLPSKRELAEKLSFSENPFCTRIDPRWQLELLLQRVQTVPIKERFPTFTIDKFFLNSTVFS